MLLAKGGAGQDPDETLAARLEQKQASSVPTRLLDGETRNLVEG